MLSNGDIIVSTSRYPFIRHYCIFAQDNNGHKKLIGNTYTDGVTIEDYHIYFSKYDFLSSHKSPISGISYDDLMKRYNNLKEKKYHLFNFDCQDFVCEMTGDKGTWIKPKQVYTAMGVAATGLIIWGSYVIIRKAVNRKRNSP